MSSEDNGFAGAHAGDEQAFTCPHCQGAVEATLGDAARAVECPICGGEFVLPAADGSVEEDAAPEPEHRATDRELDSLRMRNMVFARRAAMRSRSYALIGAGLCLIGGAKLVTMTLAWVRAAGWGWVPVLYIILAALAGWATVQLLRQAAVYMAESQAAVAPEPDAPPDFSTLSDGSQIAEQLKDVR